MTTKKAKKLIFWDSDIFITWMHPAQELKKKHKCDQSHIDAINQMVDLLESDEVIIVTTALTRVEVLATDVPKEASDKFEKLWESDTFEIISPEERVVKKAHDIRNYYKVLRKEKKLRNEGPDYGTPTCFDAVQLATAIHFGCEFLFTFDGSGKKGGGLIALSGKVADQWHIIIRKPNIPCLGFTHRGDELFGPGPAEGGIDAT